ncbi:MAG: glycosyltransferase family 2 protein, partial [Planctomycetales bacterium]|nr:glycosyltransferase family 2 protein [Planctomycetales bacterium]
MDASTFLPKSSADLAREAEFVPQLSLVLPAYNEAEVIAQAIHEADAALSRLDVTFEIIVVDDGSKDDTVKIASEVDVHGGALVVVEQGLNQGYGAALRRGFAEARGAW